ncbi:DUF1636 domain-containing protein [Methylobrevis pamukkalensis]|uniref:Metal-binding protein n=1 Tax=Methylobrevis pamukkalensis TaxID=1439726 RepID=A0A1E3H0K7_9HYPH|nr:DUF1636 domain-containing protein [Methylobrevis pamukkalensis]ODN69849.1 hypothetical protein A6302_02836 [Methylobrevis pamukkalensis]
MAARLADTPAIAVTAVECLSVCKRPCTVALAGPGRWTYVVADLDAGDHAADVELMARAYLAAPDGVVPWRTRPQTFRKGVVARVPPLDRRPTPIIRQKEAVSS